MLDMGAEVKCVTDLTKKGHIAKISRVNFISNFSSNYSQMNTGCNIV